MELNFQQLEELKAVELDIFKAFIAVCEKLNLKYYIIGGTLLGAVRHQGFIPWDDDIDIGMVREDYEIFISEGQKYLPSNMFLQTIYTETDYLLNMAKIRNSKTTFWESNVKSKKINHGVFIDVFPLDYYVPEKDKKTFNFKRWLYDARIYSEFDFQRTMKLRTKIFEYVMKKTFPDVKKVLRKRENLYKQYNEGTYIVNYCGAWGEKEIVPAEWYAEGVQLEFEGLQVYGPKEYHSWLTQVYGDYLQLPPVEKRKSHHYTEVIDLNRPYTDYI